MGLMYSATFDNIAFAAADDDIWELTAAAGRSIILHELLIESQETTAEALRVQILRRSTGGTGTAVTARALDEDNSVSAETTVDRSVGTPGTSGNILRNFTWEQLGPLHWLPTPETRIKVAGGGIVAVNLIAAPAASRNFSSTIVFEEC